MCVSEGVIIHSDTIPHYSFLIFFILFYCIVLIETSSGS